MATKFLVTATEITNREVTVWAENAQEAFDIAQEMSQRDFYEVGHEFTVDSAQVLYPGQRFENVLIMGWGDTEPTATVVSIGGDIEAMARDEEFDSMVYFYFENEEEFQKHYDPDYNDEFYIVKEED